VSLGEERLRDEHKRVPYEPGLATYAALFSLLDDVYGDFAPDDPGARRRHAL
jgi:hypothetical protein